MLGNKEFRKICNLTKNFLRNRPILCNLGNPFLYVVNGHPFILSRYKSLNNNRINFIYITKYIYELLINLIKIKLFVIKLIFSKNFLKINKNFKKGYLVVSHLINSENFKKGIDTQYNGIEKEIPKKKALFFYLDHINVSNKDKYHLSNKKKNFVLNNDCIQVSLYIKIIIKILSEFSYLIKKANKTKKNYEKKFYLECAKYLFSLSTIKNIILFYNLEKLIIKKKVSKFLITLEGHPYEHLIFWLGKIYKIKVYAYQNTYITKSHFSMFLNLGKNYLPTKILANSKLSYSLLKKKFKADDVLLLGSYKYNKTKIKLKGRLNKKNNCLVMPTGLESETTEFLKLCQGCFKIDKNLNTKFIIRLHPLIDKLEFIKKNKKILNKEKRIEISNSKLEKDISQCKFVLYKYSSSVIETMQFGLVPIFFHDIKNNFQFDALWQLKSKPVIKNSYQLKKVLNEKSGFSKKKILEYKKFANNFYYRVDQKILNKIFL